MKSTRVALLTVFFALALLCAAEEELDDECLKACNLNYWPVCGTKADGTTMEFGNRCDYEIYECRHPNEITTVINGRCR